MEQLRAFMAWWKTDTFVKVGMAFIGLACSWFVLELIIAATASPFIQFWSGLGLAFLWYGMGIWYASRPALALRWHCASYATLMSVLLWLQHSYALLNPWFVCVVAGIAAWQLWRGAYAQRSLFAYGVNLLGVTALPIAVFGGVVSITFAVVWCVVVWVLGMVAAFKSALSALYDYVSLATLLVLLLCAALYNGALGFGYVLFVITGILLVWWALVIVRMLHRGRQPMALWPYFGSVFGVLGIVVVSWVSAVTFAALVGVVVVTGATQLFFDRQRVTPLFVVLTWLQGFAALYTLIVLLAPVPMWWWSFLFVSLVTISSMVAIVPMNTVRRVVVLTLWVVPLLTLYAHVPPLVPLVLAYGLSLYGMSQYLFMRQQHHDGLVHTLGGLVLLLVGIAFFVYQGYHQPAAITASVFVGVALLGSVVARVIPQPRLIPNVLMNLGIFSTLWGIAHWGAQVLLGNEVSGASWILLVLWGVSLSFVLLQASTVYSRTVLVALSIPFFKLVALSLLPLSTALLVLLPAAVVYAVAIYRYGQFLGFATARLLLSCLGLTLTLGGLLATILFFESNQAIALSVFTTTAIVSLFTYSHSNILRIGAGSGELLPVTLYATALSSIWAGCAYTVGLLSVLVLGYAKTPQVLILCLGGLAYGLILYGRYRSDYVLVGVSGFILLLAIARGLAIEVWSLPPSLQLVPFLLTGIALLSLSLKRFNQSSVR